MPGRTVRIEETTLGSLDGWDVTIANVMPGKFRTPDGAEHEGITAVVGLYESGTEHGEHEVGAGSELTIAGKTWRVVRVVRGEPGDNGHVELAEKP